MIPLLMGTDFNNAEARCATDRNGNVIGHCSLPSAPSSEIIPNQPPIHVNVPMVLYLVLFVCASCGVTSFLIMKKIK